MTARHALPFALVLGLLGLGLGLASARPGTPLPRSLKDIRYVDGDACWVAPRAAGCNVYGCFKNGGGCNVHGCWSGPRGSCNVYGCTDVGECNVHGCPTGRVRPQRVCVAEADLPDVLGYDPDGPGGCNVHGCWDAGGGCNVYGCWSHLGGCNVHGCWSSPIGACNVYGCSDRGTCTVHGCP
ncbi:MAG: hypothetical protein R3B06_21475 [Kofleriaceae bacterium]